MSDNFVVITFMFSGKGNTLFSFNICLLKKKKKKIKKSIHTIFMFQLRLTCYHNKQSTSKPVQHFKLLKIVIILFNWRVQVTQILSSSLEERYLCLKEKTSQTKESLCFGRSYCNQLLESLQPKVHPPPMNV